MLFFDFTTKVPFSSLLHILQILFLACDNVVRISVGPVGLHAHMHVCVHVSASHIACVAFQCETHAGKAGAC